MFPNISATHPAENNTRHSIYDPCKAQFIMIIGNIDVEMIDGSECLGCTSSSLYRYRLPHCTDATVRRYTISSSIRSQLNGTRSIHCLHDGPTLHYII